VTSPLRALIVADDLTGAADTGVGFAGGRGRVRVELDRYRGDLDGGDVLIIDTDSRRSAADDAAARVTAAVAGAPPAHVLLKKVDSTLRGNVGAEVWAMLAATGRSLALCAPAFPATGRVTRHGVQWAGGCRVGDLREVLGDDPAVLGRPATWAGSEPERLATATGVVVVDGETDADLMDLVQAADPIRDRVLWVGCGGLGAALSGTAADLAPPEPVTGPVMVVVGSTAEASMAQAAALRREGLAEVRFSGHALLEVHGEPLQRTAVAVAARLSEGDVLVTIDPDWPVPEELGRRLIHTLGSALAAAGARPAGLIATGGETARGAALALGASGIDLHSQLEPGVVLGRLVGGPGCPVVTKAGGFGDEACLIRALRALRPLAAHKEKE
jgi:4-hydroxythreonine-4-phosphate dehydrogenase